MNMFSHIGQLAAAHSIKQAETISSIGPGVDSPAGEVNNTSIKPAAPKPAAPKSEAPKPAAPKAPPKNNVTFEPAEPTPTVTGDPKDMMDPKNYRGSANVKPRQTTTPKHFVQPSSAGIQKPINKPDPNSPAAIDPSEKDRFSPSGKFEWTGPKTTAPTLKGTEDELLNRDLYTSLQKHIPKETTTPGYFNQPPTAGAAPKPAPIAGPEEYNGDINSIVPPKVSATPSESLDAFKALKADGPNPAYEQDSMNRLGTNALGVNVVGAKGTEVAPATPAANDASPVAAASGGIGAAWDGLSPTMKWLLGLGIPAAGAYGLYSLMKKKGHKEDEKYGSDKLSQLMGARKDFIKQAKEVARYNATIIMGKYLVKAAADVPNPMAKGFRVIQASLTTGHTMGQAISAAFPKMIHEKRALFAKALTKNAWDLFVKEASSTSCCKQSRLKTFTGKPAAAHDWMHSEGAKV